MRETKEKESARTPSSSTGETNAKDLDGSALEANDASGDDSAWQVRDSALPADGRFSMREAVLAAIAALALIAAVLGFWLYSTARVPDGVAAKVNDFYVTESDVSSWIERYRAANSLSDDDDFANALNAMNMNVASFRQSAVNQLALQQLVEDRADELGITVSDDEVNEQFEAAKEQLSFGDEETWANTLSMFGLDEESLRAQYRSNILQNKIFEAEVPKREASEEETLSYAQRYLSGSTQKHVYRIVFTGDSADERAGECHEKLRNLASEGDMSLQSFIDTAKRYSDEEDVQETGGSYAWSGGSMSDEVKALVEDLDAGLFSAPQAVASDDAVEIFYCDQEYTFPAYSDFSSIPEDMPEELVADVANAASSAAWGADCDAYLATMLFHAKITYYPVPDDASYNVSLLVPVE